MDDYWQILNNKLYSVVREGRHKQAWDGPAAESQYEEELSLIRPHFKPIVWGFGSSVAVFISFRFNRSGAFMKSGGLLQRMSAVKNTLENQKMTMKESLFSLPGDLFLSTMIGLSTAIFLSDFSRIKQDVERIPLVKGRSLVADELCTDFVLQYNRMFFNSEKKLVEQNKKIDQSLITFILNCKKRKEVEEYLQVTEYVNGQDKIHPDIPSPGVEGNLRLIEKSKIKS